MSRHLTSLVVAVVMTMVPAGPAAGQWAQFRGPNGSGVGSASEYPVEFSPSTNLRWKAPVPFGQSSPVVAGNRLFVTASDGDHLMTICLDAASGREVWRRTVTRARAHKIYRLNDPASPTPIADDHGVVVFFPDIGLVAYGNDGQQRWRHTLGPFRNFYGMAGSPILAGDMIILVCDQQAGSFILALDRASGKVRWKADRPGRTVSWTTPSVFRPPDGPAQLIVLGSTSLDAYDLTSGGHLWWLPVGSMGALGVPVISRDTVLVSTIGTGEPWMPDFGSALEKHDQNKDQQVSAQEFAGDKDLGEHFGWIDDNDNGLVTRAEWDAARALGLGEFGAVALRPGNATGRLQGSAIRWRFQKNLPFIPAPLLYQDVFYMVRDGGIVTALDAATGRLLKEGRSRDALGEYYASPVAADGKIFLASGDGKITVLRAAPAWEVLRVNDLGEEIRATPALDGGRVFVRTREAVYCFGMAR
jgi:outer membrane protein assembly factor BamB